MRKLLLILVLLIVNITFFTIKAKGDSSSTLIGNADESCKSAFLKIAEAEKAGADVRGLVLQLNQAINLTAQAKDIARQGDLTDACSYADEAITLCNGIVDKAEQLTKCSTGRTI